MAFAYPLITIETVDYPAFTSLVAAKAYLAPELDATGWAAGDDVFKSKTLVTATRILDRQKWQGARAEADQLLAWPRTGIDGIDPATIPQAVADATAALASAIANGYDAAGQQSTANGIKRQKAGSVEQEFFATFAIAGGRFPLPVLELLAGLLISSGRDLGIGGSFSSGTCGDSAFTPDYGIVGSGVADPRRRDWA